jgi:hypothetical protein
MSQNGLRNREARAYAKGLSSGIETTCEKVIDALYNGIDTEELINLLEHDISNLPNYVKELVKDEPVL